MQHAHFSCYHRLFSSKHERIADVRVTFFHPTHCAPIFQQKLRHHLASKPASLSTIPGKLTASASLYYITTNNVSRLILAPLSVIHAYRQPAGSSEKDEKVYVRAFSSRRDRRNIALHSQKTVQSTRLSPPWHNQGPSTSA